MRPWGISILLSLAAWGVLIGWLIAVVESKGVLGGITLGVVTIIFTAWVIKGLRYDAYEDDDINCVPPDPPKEHR